MRKSGKTGVLAAVTPASLVGLAAAAAMGQATSTWDGGGANDRWATAANWSPNGVPATTSRVVFGDDPSERFSVDLGGVNRTVRSATFNDAGFWFMENGRLQASEYVRIRDFSEVFFEGASVVTPVLQVLEDAFVGLDGTTTNSIGSVELRDGSLGLNDFSHFGAPINLMDGINLLTVDSLNAVTLASPLTGAGGLLIDSYWVGEVDFQPLILTGANAGFAGPLHIMDGVVRIGNGNALGHGGFSTATSTTIDAYELFDEDWGEVITGGGQLQLEGNWSSDEHMHIVGSGPDGTGALRSLSGVQTLTNAIAIDRDPDLDHPTETVIRTEAGATLRLAGTLYSVGSGQLLIRKTGPGALEYTGPAGTSNTFPGWTDVEEGTLVLSKGRIGAGDNYGSAVGNLRIYAGATVRLEDHWQIRDDAIVRLLGGVLDMNGVTDAVHHVRLENGALVKSSVPTGAELVIAWINDQSGISAYGNSTIAVNTSLHGTRPIYVDQGGSLLISGAVTGASGGIRKQGQGTLVLSASGAYGGPTIVEQGSLSFAANQSINQLDVWSGATAAISDAPGRNLRITALQVAPGGTLDIGMNRLIVDYAGATPIEEIAALVQAGRMTGTGIVSSTAPAHFAIGYGEAAIVVAPDTTWSGISVDSTAVLVMSTLVGDANLDGTVGFEDLLMLAQSYGHDNTFWTSGDFNHDTVTGFDDLLALAQNYGLSRMHDGGLIRNADASFAADWALAQALVPEPGTLAIVCLSGVMIRRGRRQAMI